MGSKVVEADLSLFYKVGNGNLGGPSKAMGKEEES